jgi:hypothetical protein
MVSAWPELGPEVSTKVSFLIPVLANATWSYSDAQP